MSERIAKQVIVMRTDLNMRKGKMIAQGAHASVGAVWLIETGVPYSPAISDAYHAWRTGTFTKVCVQIDSEDALRQIHAKAYEAGLPVKFIVDSGKTEFNGVPTPTCLAIGPAWADEIDKVTGLLPLL